MIRLKVEEHIAILTIDRPPVNALDDAAYRELGERFAVVGKYPDVRVVVITGAGQRAFCAGSDLRELHRRGEDATAHERHGRLVSAMLMAVYECPVPVIAAVQAAAVGAGVGIAAACDFVIAADSAPFRLPEIDQGVVGGVHHLRRLAPEGMTRYMALTGESVDAVRLLAQSRVGRVSGGVDTMAEAMRIATVIAGKPPTTVRVLKRAMNHMEQTRMDLQRGFDYERSLKGE